MAEIGYNSPGGVTSPDPGKTKELLVKSYPPKVGRKRAKAILANDPQNVQEIQSNVRTVPGIITQRGCTYAGCKGVVPTDGAAASWSFGLSITPRHDKPDARAGALNETVAAPVHTPT